jgi:hypothetical protein
MSVLTACCASGVDARTAGYDPGPHVCAAHGVNPVRDVEHGGPAIVRPNTQTMLQTGPGTFAGYPYCRIWIIDLRNGMIVRQVYSDADGNYSVAHLNPAIPYLAIAFDPQNLYDVAATRDLVVS